MNKIIAILTILGLSCIGIAILLLTLDGEKKPLSKATGKFENNLETAIIYIKNNISYNVDSFEFVEINDKGEYIFNFIDKNKNGIQLIVDINNKKSQWIGNFGGIG